MRLGSWMAAAPGILTSKTPFSKLALILSSSTSWGSCRLLRNEPERRSLTRYPLRSSSLSSSSLPEMVRTPLWTVISTSSGLAPGSSALTTRSSSSCITSMAGDQPAICVLCSSPVRRATPPNIWSNRRYLAQRVVEPAAPLSAHHGLYPLLSLSPATRGGKHRACLYRLRRPMLNLLPYQISPSSAEPYWTRRGVCISDWCSDRRRYRRPRPVGRAPDRQERVRWRCLQAGTLPPG